MAEVPVTTAHPRHLTWRLSGLLILLIATGAYGLGALSARNKAATTLLRPDDAQVVAMGAHIYMQHCAACHGARGEGQPNWRERDLDGFMQAPPHDESGHTWHHPDAQLIAITKHGLAQQINQPEYQTRMPVYNGVLSDSEIVAVLSWIKAQWPHHIREQHDQINAQHHASTGR